MRSNARTVRLSGTVFSRTLEMQQDLAVFIEEHPHATEIPLDWVLEFVDKLEGAARGTFATSIDTQTVLRLAVSHRLEKALKVDHLTTTNPLKAEKEDFIPPIAMKRIEDAAKRNLDLSWALDQTRGKDSSLAAALKIPPGAGSRTTRGSEVEVVGPAREGSAKAAKAAIVKAAAAAARGLAQLPVPNLGRTPCRPSRRPLGPPASLGGPRPSPQPRERRAHNGADLSHERGPQEVPDQAGPDDRFDSTRGFPGEGPAGTIDTPWFLASKTTRGIVDIKRRRLDNTTMTVAPTIRRLVFSTPPLRVPASTGHRAPIQTDTALARFLKAHRGRTNPSPRLEEVVSGDAPVPLPPAPPAPVFACLRELQDFTNPLPPIPADESMRKAFILHFGGTIKQRGTGTIKPASSTPWESSPAIWSVSCGANANAAPHILPSRTRPLRSRLRVPRPPTARSSWGLRIP